MMNETRKLKMIKKELRLNEYAKLIRKQNNKRLRKFNGDLKDGSYYKKVFEYWFELF